MEEDQKEVSVQTLVNKYSEEQYAQSLILDFIRRSRDRSNALIWQMDISITVAEILQSCAGIFVKYVDNKPIIIQSENPPMNYKGVLLIYNHLTPILNKDSISSNLSMQEIKQITCDFAIGLDFNLVRDYDDYGISDFSQAMVLKNNIVNAIFIALKRTFEDGTRTMMAKIINVSETYQRDEKGKKTSILDDITGRTNN